MVGETTTTNNVGGFARNIRRAGAVGRGDEAATGGEKMAGATDTVGKAYDV